MNELIYKGVGFTIRLFPGMKKIMIAPEDMGVFAGVDAVFRDDNGALVTISKKGNIYNIRMTPDYLSLCEREVSQSVPDYRKIGMAIKDIGNFSCGAIQYMSQYAENSIRTILFTAINERHIVIISCTVLETLFESYRKKFFELVETIEEI